jgi:hypothetical protein
MIGGPDHRAESRRLPTRASPPSSRDVVFPTSAPLPTSWDQRRGACGCTAENCAFRDPAPDLRAERATVMGLRIAGSARKIFARTPEEV